MSPKPSGPRKGLKFLDVKLFIAVLALVVTIGVWNLLSTYNLQNFQASPDPLSAPPPQTSQASPELAPLPTLVALVPVDTTGTAAPQASAADRSKPATLTLRAVTAPDQSVVQKSNPVVQAQPSVVVVGGGAVATTRSSR